MGNKHENPVVPVIASPSSNNELKQVSTFEMCCYVPDRVILFHLPSSEQHKRPHMNVFPAVLAFVDMSGFTPLTSRLEAKGSIGIEKLSFYLNDYFGKICEIIMNYGGDVLKFVGDALLVMWPAGECDNIQESKEVTEIALKALQCVQCLHTKYDGYSPVSNITLNLHSALSFGQVIELHVGGVQNLWEYIVKGQPLQQLAIACHHSEKSTIALSRGFSDLVRAHVQLAALTDDVWRFEHFISPPSQSLPPSPLHSPTNPPFTTATSMLSSQLSSISLTVPNTGKTSSSAVFVKSPLVSLDHAQKRVSHVRCGVEVDSLGSQFRDAMCSYVPFFVQSRISEANRGWMAEFRKITVLFVCLPDVQFEADLRDPEALNKSLFIFQSIVTIVQAITYKCHGVVRQLVQDDKGTIMLLAFGLQAHLDAARYGVQAALNIVQELKLHSSNVRVGVTTGMTFCGCVGSAYRCEYTLVGDVVNTSARLMGAAVSHHSASILCCETTFKELSERSKVHAYNQQIGFRALSPVILKGKAQPVPVYEPFYHRRRSMKSSIKLVSDQSLTKLIGRSNEIQLVIKHLQQKLAAYKSTPLMAMQPNNRLSTTSSVESRCIIVVEGESGVGKTTFVNYIARQAKSLGVRVIMMAGEERERHHAYYVMSNLLYIIFRKFVDQLTQLKLSAESNNIIEHHSSVLAVYLIYQSLSSSSQALLPLLADVIPFLEVALKFILINYQTTTVVSPRNAESPDSNELQPTSAAAKEGPALANAISCVTVEVLKIIHYLESDSDILQLLVAEALPIIQHKLSVYEQLSGPVSSLVNRDDGSVPSFESPISRSSKSFRQTVARFNQEDIELLASSPPYVAIVEDWQWIDGASEEFLQRAVSSMDHMFLLLTFNTSAEQHPSSAWYRSIVNSSNTLRLTLSRLSKGNVEELVRAQFQVNYVNQDVVNVLYQRSQGNPLYLQSLMYSMAEKQILKVIGETISLDASMYSTEQPVYATVPISLRDVIGSQLDTLLPPQQLLLKVCSVFGMAVPFDVIPELGAIMMMDLKSLSMQCEVLCASGFLQAITSEKAAVVQQGNPIQQSYDLVSYTFRHRLIRDVAYSRLLFSQRMILHERIANWYEQHYTDNLKPYYSPLAFHWSAIAQAEFDETQMSSKVEASRKAIEYLKLLGIQYVRGYTCKEAVACLGEAIQLFSSLPVQEREEKWLDELQFLNWYAFPAVSVLGSCAMVNHFERMLEICQMHSQDTSKLQDFIFQATSGMCLGIILSPQFPSKLDQFMALAARALQIAEETKDDEKLIQAYRINGMANYSVGRLTTAIKLCDSALQLYVPSKHFTGKYCEYDPGTVSAVTEAYSLAACGQFARALVLLRKARELAKFHNHPLSQQYASMYTSGVSCALELRQLESDAFATSIQLYKEHSFQICFRSMLFHDMMECVTLHRTRTFFLPPNSLFQRIICQRTSSSSPSSRTILEEATRPWMVDRNVIAMLQIKKRICNQWISNPSQYYGTAVCRILELCGDFQRGYDYTTIWLGFDPRELGMRSECHRYRALFHSEEAVFLLQSHQQTSEVLNDPELSMYPFWIDLCLPLSVAAMEPPYESKKQQVASMDVSSLMDRVKSLMDSVAMHLNISLDIARAQEAKALELRTLCTICKLQHVFTDVMRVTHADLSDLKQREFLDPSTIEKSHRELQSLLNQLKQQDQDARQEISRTQEEAQVELQPIQVEDSDFQELIPRHWPQQATLSSSNHSCPLPQSDTSCNEYAMSGDNNSINLSTGSIANSSTYYFKEKEKRDTPPLPSDSLKCHPLDVVWYGVELPIFRKAQQIITEYHTWKTSILQASAH